MKNLAEKLQDQKSSQEAMEMEENIDDLRQIMENLVKLSFDQEKLMKDFRNIRVGDPRFVKLGQTQLKLKDDAKVVEDSLYALANRVFQIKSFVTREVGLMKYYFAFAVFGLTLIAVLIWFSKSNAQYVFLHNVIKIIILVGVFSLMFIDTSVIIDRIISEL